MDERMANGLAKIVTDKDCLHVLTQFLEQAGPMRDSFNPDPYIHAHAAGWKSAGQWWIQQGLLHDKDFMSKIQADDGLPITMESQDDGHNEHDNDSSPGDSGG